MYARGTRLLVSVILVTLLPYIQNTAVTVFCAKIPPKEIACIGGTFQVGQRASVTCNFPTDVGADKKDIVVGRLPLNASKNAVWIDTLVCGWKSDNLKYDCNVAKGYRFDGVIDRHLTLHIPTVSAERAGTYICFIVSSHLQSKECTLTVTEPHTSLPETTTENATWSLFPEKARGGSEVNLALIIAFVAVVLHGGMAALLVFFCFKRRCKRHAYQTPTLQDASAVVRSKERKATKVNPVPTLHKKVSDLLEGFDLTSQACEKLMVDFEEELNCREQRTQCASEGDRIPLLADTEANKKMYPVPIQRLANTTEADGIMVVEVKNAMVRIHRVMLHIGKQPDIKLEDTMNYPIPPDIRQGTGYQLFEFIANCTDQFFNGKKRKFCLGFVFPFPLEYSGDLTKARMTKWANGFLCEDLVGQDVHKLIEQAFKRKHEKNRLKRTVILHDGAGTLLSSAYGVENPDFRIAVSLAEGFYACHRPEEGNRETNADEGTMNFTSSVLGALGENGCLREFMTEYDKDLDRQSVNPGRQILEKMVSLAHTGELVRLVLAKLEKEKLLFRSAPHRSTLKRMNSFTAEFVCNIVRDKTEDIFYTDKVLRELQVENYTEEDCKIVRHVVHAVLKRAAYLAAAALAVLINPLNEAEVSVAVDEALYRQHPSFLDLLQNMIEEIVKPQKEIRIDYPLSTGSVFGAALAVNATRSANTA